MRLRPVPARLLIRFLNRRGFQRVSQRGSHLKMRHQDGRMVVLPIHPGRPIKVGLLRKILAEAGAKPEEFLDEL